MKKLVSTSEASKILGISVQGIHYRIKTNKLESTKKDGKTFVYIDSNINQKEKQTPIDSNILLKSKDEQILLLKKTIKWMKKQYKQEIKRINNDKDKIIEVFKSEITLLQQAYNEMQSLYKITNKNDNTDTNSNFEMMDIKEFYKFMKSYSKSDEQIKTIILTQIKANDKRFVYNIEKKELLIYKSDFIDLI